MLGSTRLALALWLVACGSTMPPRAVSMTPDEEAAPEAARAEAPAPSSEPSDPEPTVLAEPAPPARLEVSAPSDLSTAIAARLPTIELVPESCGEVFGVATTNERVCLGDPSGRTRAMRRFATSRYPALTAARFGEEIVFGVLDGGSEGSGATTRYDRRLWIWDLHADAYRGIFALGPDDYLTDATALPFGVLVRTELHAWIYDGSLEAIRTSDIVAEYAARSRLVVVDGAGFELRTDGDARVVSALRREGGRLFRDELVRVPASSTLEPRFADSGEAIRADGTIAWVTWSHHHATLTMMHLPSPETTSVRLEVEREPRRVFWREDELRVAVFARGGGSEEWLVDLPTGGLLAAPARGEPRDPLAPRSIHALAITAGGVHVALRDRGWELTASGVASRRTATADAASCACRDTALVCGSTTIEGGCAEVAELDSIDAGPSTHFGPRHRIDRLEPDHLRVTRLSDGARLWIRVLGDVVFAQADDGAFAAEGLSSEGWSVRWGHDLSSAPVSALAPVRAQLERPSLVTDFFAGNALPAADTTLP